MVLQASAACRAQMTVGWASKPLSSWKAEEGGAGQPCLCWWARSHGTARETTAFWLPACSAHAGQGKSRSGHSCFFLWHLKLSSARHPSPSREQMQLIFQFSSWHFLLVLFRGLIPLWFHLSLSTMGKSRWTTTDNPALEGMWSDRNKARLGAEGGHWRFLEALLLPSLKWERKEDVFGYI